MTAPRQDLDAMLGPYAELYRAIQDRMRPGQVLAADSPHQTMTGHFHHGTWTRERLAAHRRILTDLRWANADKPRDGRAILLTAGPPGAGKTSALQLLDQLRQQHAPLAEELTATHPRLADFVIVDPDQFKRALLTDPTTRPELPDRALGLPGGHRLAPAEMANLVHAESRHLANQFALWAREHGHNLLYDTTLRTLNGHHALLADLATRGYHHRTLLSVETPLHTALTGNATRWRDGRHAFDTGTNPYGGRMAPEHYIRALYPNGPAERSTSRTNARRLAADGAITGTIEIDRGNTGNTGDAEPRPGTSTHRLADTTVHITTGGSAHTTNPEVRPQRPVTLDVAQRLRQARQLAITTGNGSGELDPTTDSPTPTSIPAGGHTRQPEVCNNPDGATLHRNSGTDAT
ncbi:MAG TPA: zeta toxin family protein [Mycobacteriales bacterium]|nr:zeta toxin family protein [Mycobacteriales bacterium]